MLQIGQIRKSNSTRYLDSLPITKAYVYNKGDTNNVVFRDFALDLGTAGFQAKQSYYLRFAVQRYPEDTQGRQYGDYDTVNFTLVLCNEAGEPDTGEHSTSERLQTVEKNLVITPYRKDDKTGTDLNSPWQQFSLVFTPTEPARYLWFKINRIGYDYIYPSTDDSSRMGRSVFQYYGANDDRNTVEFSNRERHIDIEIEVDAKEEYYKRVRESIPPTMDRNAIMQIVDNAFKNPEDPSKLDIGLFWQGDKDVEPRVIEVSGEFSKVNNILPQTVNQIGIQSRPGSLFVVNHEPIYLGRSGVYEVNNGTNIQTIGVVAPDGADVSNIQDFIIDYAYVTEEG